MAVKTIKTLAHFIAACSEIEIKHDHTLFYRGHASKSFVPLPAIFRHQDNNPQNEKFILREDELFHNLITRCPSDFINCSSTFDYLVKMQHYGLPTRLLDITSNPLVALYFACNAFIPKSSKDSSADDGQVLIYQVPNDQIKYYHSDTVSLVSNLAKVGEGFNISSDDDIERFIHTIQAEKPYFKNKINKDHLRSVICVRPKLDNPRIIKQSGAFFLFGMGNLKTDSISIDEKFKPKLKHLEIPKGSKQNLLNELETLSISQGTLFPEIDSVARFLTNTKIPKAPKVESVDQILINAGVSAVELNNYIKIIATKVAENEYVMEQISNNSKQQAMLGELPLAINDAVIASMEHHNELAVKVLSDTELFNHVTNLVFDNISEKEELNL